ncbi:MAG: hypothetical protein WBV94_34010 [Blastocatellia bacterium]
MSTLLEKIIEEVKTLTLEEQRQLRDLLNSQTDSSEQTQRDRLAASIRGKYAGILTGSDEFAAHKSEELVLEEQR